MGSKSKKGSQFERDFSKFLSIWVQGTSNPLLFWRQISSGGLLKVYQNVDKNLSGDIHAIHKDGEFLTNIFSIELKAGYKDGSFDKHPDELTSDHIFKFWSQAVSDCSKVSKIPILIYNKLRSFTVIGITKDTNEKLKEYLTGLRYIHLAWKPEENLPEAYFYDMNKFFNTITPDMIKNKFLKE